MKHQLSNERPRHRFQTQYAIIHVDIGTLYYLYSLIYNNVDNG